MNDWYTKTVLTVIALCLIALVFRDTEVAHAQESDIAVTIVGIDLPRDADALPVKIEDTVDVNLTHVDNIRAIPVRVE